MNQTILCKERRRMTKLLRNILGNKNIQIFDMKNYKIIVSIHAWPQMKPMKGWDSKMEQT
jgi:hypothetical protein